MRSRWISAGLAAALFIAGCGEKQKAAAAPAAADGAIAAAGDGPAMWRVADDDSTIYLFGTFHLLPAALEWTSPAYEAAMAETPFTMVEVDAKSPEAQARMSALVRALGLNPPGVTLSERLGPARAARFRAIAERYGASMAAMESLKPWLAMITLSVHVMQQEGFQGETGAEAAILARAAAEGDRIAYLESAEYQIRALASLDEEEILADFDASLEQFDDFRSFSQRMLGAWRRGDIAALEKETLAPMRETAPAAFRTLITDRNANWAREIESILDGSDDYFIAVGAGHLIGEDSLVDLLEEAGRRVERVQ
jgi:hypothetical protein